MACQFQRLKQNLSLAVVSINDKEIAGKLHWFKYEFNLWASMANYAEFAKHTYTRDANNDDWIITSASCEGVVPGDQILPGRRVCCRQCIDLIAKRYILRACLKFATKFHAAELLTARLFQGEAETAAVETSIKSGQLYKSSPELLDQLIACDASALQQFVRASFKSDSRPTENMKKFVAHTVDPALAVNVDSVPARLADCAAKFTALLRGSETSEQAMIDVKIAAAAIQGKLSNHPLVQGLILCVQRQFEKESRNISTLRGRTAAEISPMERQLMADAGLQLSIACGNHTLAREFGACVSAGNMHKLEEQLHTRSLPQPSLAICLDGQLEQNFHLADQRYVRPHMAPKSVLLSIVG